MFYFQTSKCIKNNVCNYCRTTTSLCYLAEGSRLWMVVMKMSTMKAHTRLDLNTSSLIWEYWEEEEQRERERRKEEGGGGEGKMERQVFRLTKETGHVELAPQTRRRHRHRCMQMFSTTSVRERRELAG